MTEEDQTGLSAGNDIPPWLQPVPAGEDEAAEASGRRKLILTSMAAVALIVLFVSVVFYLYDGSGTGAPRHIKAPTAPVKERPKDVGGLRVAHQDKQVFNSVDGIEARSEVTIGAQPEEPLAELPAEPVEAKPAMDAIAKVVEKTTDIANDGAVARTSVPKVAEKAGPAKTTAQLKASAQKAYRVQLGAYGTEASAARAWKATKGKFPMQFEDKSATYEAVKSGSRTLFRLRVGPLKTRVEADQVCLALRAGQQACIVVNP